MATRYVGKTSYVYDLSSPDDCEYYFDFLGGAEYVKQKAPTVYKRFMENVQLATTRAADDRPAKIHLDADSFTVRTDVTRGPNEDKAEVGGLLDISFECTIPDDRAYRLEGTDEAKSLEGLDHMRWKDLKAIACYRYILGRDAGGKPIKFSPIIGSSMNKYTSLAELQETMVAIAQAEIGDLDNRLDIQGHYEVRASAPNGQRVTTYMDKIFAATGAKVERTFIEEVKITHPRNDKKDIRSLAKEYIVILYNRSTYENPDYIYNAATNKIFTEKGNLSYVHTIIPVSVTFKLGRGFRFCGVSDKQEGFEYDRSWLSFTSSLTSTTQRVRHYNALDDASYIEKLSSCCTVNSSDYSDEVTFNFGLFSPEDTERLPDDWRDDIATKDKLNPQAYMNHLNKAALVAKFPLKIGDDNYPGEYDDVLFMVSSKPQSFLDQRSADLGVTMEYYKSIDPISNAVYIPELEIWWGCYARETLIRLADGSEKRADAIAMGDKLPAMGNKIVTVSGVSVGVDENIVEIKTDNGKSIRVSAAHPMLLRGNFAMPAGKLLPGDMLMLENGLSKIVSIEMVSYNDMVFNFSFENETEGNYILANGFWSGDIIAQSRLPRADESGITHEQSAEDAQFDKEFEMLLSELSSTDVNRGEPSQMSSADAKRVERSQMSFTDAARRSSS